MKIWIDDVRSPPEGYTLCHSVNEAKEKVQFCEKMFEKTNDTFYKIELIDTDHDAGDYAKDGGDYIKFLDWLEETGRDYPIRIHSQNPVGIQNMRNIIRHNNWIEIR